MFLKGGTVMRHLSFALLACAVLTAAAIRADEPKGDGKTNPSDRAQVTKFFKEHVIGKTLATPKTKFKWDDNKMEGDYEDQVIYNNFTETAEGFGFDVTSVSKQTLYDIDKEGKRVQPGRDFSGTFVVRYEICERASTKKLTGISRPLSSTIKAPSPEGTATLVTGMKVDGGKLTWNETLPGYADFPGIKGKYKPGSWDVKMTISIVGGKLQIEGDQTNFALDPDTLKRTPAKEKLPIFVTKEIDRN
jgi:hypothetical protein